MSRTGSNEDWKVWGRVDPLYGAVSAPGREATGPRPWTDEEFYQLGLQDWGRFVERWRQYGLNTESCLEIGCGAGRITRQLARTFEAVHALDVSKDMIARARQHVDRGSVTYHVVEENRLPLPADSVTAAFSTHVFQHFDRLADGARYFEEIARVLTDGGTLMIHLPVYAWPTASRAFELTYRLIKQVGHARAAYRRCKVARDQMEPCSRWLKYDVQWLETFLPTLGLHGVEVQIFSVKGSGRQAPRRYGPVLENEEHSFVFARKSAGPPPNR